jgi:hypothetical protein
MSSPIIEKKVLACVSSGPDYQLLQIGNYNYLLYNHSNCKDFSLNWPKCNLVIFNSITAVDSINIHAKSVILVNADLESINGTVQIKTENRFIAIASTIRSKWGNLLYSDREKVLDSWQYVSEAKMKMASVEELFKARVRSHHIKELFLTGSKESDAQEKSIPLLINALTMTANFVNPSSKSTLTDEEALEYFNSTV